MADRSRLPRSWARKADIGSLSRGKWADVILIDESVEVKATTYLAGCRLSPAAKPGQPQDPRA